MKKLSTLGKQSACRERKRKQQPVMDHSDASSSLKQQQTDSGFATLECSTGDQSLRSVEVENQPFVRPKMRKVRSESDRAELIVKSPEAHGDSVVALLLQKRRMRSLDNPRSSEAGQSMPPPRIRCNLLDVTTINSRLKQTARDNSVSTDSDRDESRSSAAMFQFSARSSIGCCISSQTTIAMRLAAASLTDDDNAVESMGANVCTMLPHMAPSSIENGANLATPKDSTTDDRSAHRHKLMRACMTASESTADFKKLRNGTNGATRRDASSSSMEWHSSIVSPITDHDYANTRSWAKQKRSPQAFYSKLSSECFDSSLPIARHCLESPLIAYTSAALPSRIYYAQLTPLTKLANCLDFIIVAASSFHFHCSTLDRIDTASSIACCAIVRQIDTSFEEKVVVSRQLNRSLHLAEHCAQMTLVLKQSSPLDDNSEAFGDSSDGNIVPLHHYRSDCSLYERLSVTAHLLSQNSGPDLSASRSALLTQLNYPVEQHLLTQAGAAQSLSSLWPSKTSCRVRNHAKLQRGTGALSIGTCSSGSAVCRVRIAPSEIVNKSEDIFPSSHRANRMMTSDYFSVSKSSSALLSLEDDEESSDFESAVLCYSSSWSDSSSDFDGY